LEFLIRVSGSIVKIKARIKTRSCLGLKSTITIELANPKSISLQKKLTPIPTPRPNVGTNIIDQIYTMKYKK